MAEHTKTPWAVHRYDRPSGGVAISGPDTDETNAFVATAFADSRTMEEAEANAAFIVRAVNCHTELVEIAARYEKHVSRQNSACGDNDGAQIIADELEELRALIAKARGETP